MSPTEPMAKRHLGSHDNGIEPKTEIKSSIGEDEPRQLYISGIGIHNMRISDQGLHLLRKSSSIRCIRKTTLLGMGGTETMQQCWRNF